MTPWDEAAVERAARAYHYARPLHPSLDEGDRDTWEEAGELWRANIRTAVTAALQAAITPELRELMEASDALWIAHHDMDGPTVEDATIGLSEAALAFAKAVRR